MKTAVVHEWVSARAGSEKVFERLAQIYPDADLYCLTKTPGVELNLGGRQVETTWLDNKFFRSHRMSSLPLMPIAWQGLLQGEYDRIVVSHHAFANSVLKNTQAKTYSYVHTPARYVHRFADEPRGQNPTLRPVQKILKNIDRRAAQRVGAIAANSREVQSRIRRVWGRDSTVIHPPVDTEYFASVGTERSDQGFLLGFSRWISYKRLDHVIDVAAKAGLPAVIAGRGPDAQRLREKAASANVDVTIVESPSDAELRDLYRTARALVFPAYEDFGIIPVECMATGTPVIGANVGGTTDTIVDGVSGYLVPADAGVEVWADAAVAAKKLDPDACRNVARKFHPSRFDQQIRDWVDGHGPQVQP